MTDSKQNTPDRPTADFVGCAMLIAMAVALGLGIRFLFDVVQGFIATSQ